MEGFLHLEAGRACPGAAAGFCATGDPGPVAGAAPFLARTDVLVCLLPVTSETRGILSEGLLSQLPPGSSLIQVGRGGHLDQEALPRLLDSQHIASAQLDVTDPEPLPPEHLL